VRDIGSPLMARCGVFGIGVLRVCVLKRCGCPRLSDAGRSALARSVGPNAGGPGPSCSTESTLRGSVRSLPGQLDLGPWRDCG